MKITFLLLAGALAAILTLSAPAQGNVEKVPLTAPIPAAEQAALLKTARANIYNLRLAGVRSFGCNVHVDWQAIFKAIANQQLPDDDARLKYLRAARLSFDQPLGDNSTAEVAWHLPAGADDDAAAKPLEVLLSSFKQMVAGFLQSWTPTLDGTLVPQKVGSMTRVGSGYRIEGAEGATSGVLTFNHALEIIHISAKVGGVDGSFDTIFAPTPHGLVMTSMDGLSTPTPNAQTVHVSIQAAFAPVEDVQLPSALEVAIPGIAVFKMNFVDCAVTRAATSTR